jgi:hypothetical protein
MYRFEAGQIIERWAVRHNLSCFASSAHVLDLVTAAKKRGVPDDGCQPSRIFVLPDEGTPFDNGGTIAWWDG